MNSLPLEEAERIARQGNGASGKSFPTTRRLALVPFDDVTLETSGNYCVKGVIPDAGLTVIWGPPKCGKSFFTSDIAFHVALGWDWRGRKVKAGPVVYVAAEGAHGFKARIQAFRQERLGEEVGPVPFYLVPFNLDLIAEHMELTGAIRETLGNVTDHVTINPVLVVIDTLNRTLRGSENSDEDMSDYIKAADAIREAFGCAVVIVHHCGIEGTRPRGHTSLSGAVDCQIAVKKANGIVSATVELMKDGQEGDAFGSLLKVVEVGTDDDGDPITSCVIEPTDAVEDSGRTRTTGQARVALDILRKLIDEHGEEPPVSTHIPQNRTKRVVRLDIWRRYWSASSAGEADKPDSVARAFRRAAEKLQASDTIGIWDGWVWLQ
jgi:hypothetical protein